MGGWHSGGGTIAGNKTDSFQVLRTQRLGSALQKAPANSSYRHSGFSGSLLTRGNFYTTPTQTMHYYKGHLPQNYKYSLYCLIPPKIGPLVQGGYKLQDLVTVNSILISGSSFCVTQMELDPKTFHCPIFLYMIETIDPIPPHPTPRTNNNI